MKIEKIEKIEKVEKVEKFLFFSWITVMVVGVLLFFVTVFFKIPADAAKVNEEKIVIVGGYGSTAEEMDYLKKNFSGSVVIIPKKFATIEEASAAFLEQLKEQKLENEQIVFIAHSWGGLIVRKISEDYPEIKIKKIITIAMPSGGYSIAPRWFWRMFYGKMPDRKSKYPLFVIAGDKGRERWFLKGSNDGIVELSSVLSVEADEIMLFPLNHLELIHNESVVEQIQLWVSN